MEKSEINFVNLHGHSTFSIYDAIGYPQEHMDFAYENGCKALALTDHGNMNGMAYQYHHWKKMLKDGKEFKAIFGIECYYHPSIKRWENLFLKSKDKDEAPAGFVSENESESKTKHKNPLRERYHMVLLAQNLKGLHNLFAMVSESYKKPYYYAGFPRIDHEMLKKHSDGIIMTSACLGSYVSSAYWQYIDEGIDVVKYEMSKIFEEMIDIFGTDRWFAELQWIRMKEQHIINQCVIEIANKYNVGLVSTCDSHYPRPEMWKDRLIYRALNPRFADQNNNIPSSVEDVGYELYPKNGDQMFADYKKYSQLAGFEYDDNIIQESIERTYDIAFNLIEDFDFDTNIKLPEFILKDDEDPNEKLRELVLEKFEERIVGSGKDEKQYLERINFELEVFKDCQFSHYFLTMNEIAKKAQELTLVNHCRGSSGGSLVCYLLEITQVDPFVHNTSFTRFMLSPDPVGICREKNNEYNPFEYKEVDSCIQICFDNDESLMLTENCKIYIDRAGKKQYICAKDLQEGDEIL